MQRSAAADVLVEAVGLVDRLAVPVETEPPQHVEDVVGQLGPVALRVGVLDPQQERARVRPREQPVAQRGVRRPDVQVARRRRREPAPVPRSWSLRRPCSDPSRSSNDFQLARVAVALISSGDMRSVGIGDHGEQAFTLEVVAGMGHPCEQRFACVHQVGRRASSSRKPHTVNADDQVVDDGRAAHERRPLQGDGEAAVDRRRRATRRSAGHDPVLQPTGEQERVALIRPRVSEVDAPRLPVFRSPGRRSPATVRPPRRRLVRAHVVHRLDGHVFGAAIPGGYRPGSRPELRGETGAIAPVHQRGSAWRLQEAEGNRVDQGLPATPR